MTSFGHQFEFYDIFHVQPCNVDNRWRSVVYKTNVRSTTYMYVNIWVSVQTRAMGNSNALFQMAELLKTLKDSFIFLIFLCVKIKINSRWQ